MKYFRLVAGVSRNDKIRNEKIRGLDIIIITKTIVEQQLRWFGQQQKAYGRQRFKRKETDEYLGIPCDIVRYRMDAKKNKISLLF